MTVPAEFCKFCGYRYSWIREHGKVSLAGHQNGDCVKPMAKKSSKIVTFELTFSDLTFGHPDLGFISREDCRDADEEDFRFYRYLKEEKHLDVLSVQDGKAKIRM
jgi:hypothetical protein